MILISAKAERSWRRAWLVCGLALCMLSLDCVAADATHLKQIGIIWSGTREATAPYWGAVVDGLRELGWVEGKTAHFHRRAGGADRDDHDSHRCVRCLRCRR